jgi:hypothetical protein
MEIKTDMPEILLNIQDLSSVRLSTRGTTFYTDMHTYFPRISWKYYSCPNFLTCAYLLMLSYEETQFIKLLQVSEILKTNSDKTIFWRRTPMGNTPLTN